MLSDEGAGILHRRPGKIQEDFGDAETDESFLVGISRSADTAKDKSDQYGDADGGKRTEKTGKISERDYKVQSQVNR